VTLTIQKVNTLELPGNWTTKEEYLNGNGKLVAKYQNTKTGEKVTVSPHKTYEGAGFCNAHRVDYWEDQKTTESVAKGLHEAEYVQDAKEQAKEKMMEAAAP